MVEHGVTNDGRAAADGNETRRTVLKGIGVAAATAVGLGAGSGTGVASGSSDASRSSYTIRSGTDEETTVYVLEGESSGPTAVVVGGMHGNEKSGWLAAGDIKDWRIDAGKLVVLPKANVPAIEEFKRPWGTWDLNRHFPSGERPTSRLAQAIWDDVIVAHDPDFVWDLHSSRGIHSEDEGVGQALFPTRAGDARGQASDIRSFLNEEYVPSSMPTYEFTGSSSVDGTRDMLKHKVGADLGTPSIIFETVYNDLSVGRQVGWTKAAVWRFLRNYGLSTSDEHTITVAGRGDTAHYEFTVDGPVTKSADYDAVINDFDEINGDTVTGRTTSQPDSFRYTGRVTEFDADAPIDVYIDGQSVDAGTLDGSAHDDVLTIAGRGDTAYYEFVVDGDVEKSTAYGGTINGYDEINGDTVTGRTTSEPDSFAFDGGIVEFEADAPVDVLLNGEEVDPETLGGRVVTIVGDGDTAYYEFTVDGAVEKSTAYGGTINDFDEIDGDTVTGRTTSEPDSFTVVGSLTDFQVDGDAIVLIDGEEVEPALLGGSVLTISGDGDTVYYEFTVDGAVEKSTAYGGTINDFDEIDGDTVTGRTTNEPDSFEIDGFVTGFDADGSPVVYVDGTQVSL